MENSKILKTMENTKGNDPFKRSGLVGRSPPAARRTAITVEQNAPVVTQNKPRVDIVANSTPQQKENKTVQSVAISSPRLELIYKMRKFEEESIAQCRDILRKMKLAILRQKNVSNDIKDGISELAEQFDVMERYRKSWKAAEEEHKESQSTKATKESVDIEPETPKTSGKRIATSPAEDTPGIGKKRREKEPQAWQVVQKKSNKRPPPESEQSVKDHREKTKKPKRPKRIKPEAVLIKPAEGNSYADVLKNLRTKMQPNEVAKVRGIRKTRTGDLLLEFNKGEKIQTSFVEEIKNTVKQAGLVTELKPMSTLEIRDLDSFTTKEEVEEAVGKLLDSKDALRIRITTPNSREQVRAFVTLPAESASIMLRLGKIRIGWIQASIRPWLNLRRCLRCLGVGHRRVDCKGQDRSNLCFRCGNPGHKISVCTGPSKCCLCVDAGRERVDHIPGSRGCPEFSTIQA